MFSTVYFLLSTLPCGGAATRQSLRRSGRGSALRAGGRRRTRARRARRPRACHGRRNSRRPDLRPYRLAVLTRTSHPLLLLLLACFWFGADGRPYTVAVASSVVSGEAVAQQ